MATTRRPPKYRIKGEGIDTEVNGAEFGKALLAGVTIQTGPRSAVVAPGYRVYVDHQRGVLAFALAETPKYDRHNKLRSWFYILLRHAIYVGEPNSLLYSHAAQVEGIPA